MTTSDPVTGATQDPRVQAVAEWLGNLQGGGGTYPHLAKICLAHADAADAAAGIRRVTVGELNALILGAQS